MEILKTALATLLIVAGLCGCDNAGYEEAYSIAVKDYINAPAKPSPKIPYGNEPQRADPPAPDQPQAPAATVRSPSAPEPQVPWIVGKWKGNIIGAEQTWEFRKDGVVITQITGGKNAAGGTIQRQPPQQGTWELKGQNLLMILPDRGFPDNIVTPSGNSFTIKPNKYLKFTFTRL